MYFGPSLRAQFLPVTIHVQRCRATAGPLGGSFLLSHLQEDEVNVLCIRWDDRAVLKGDGDALYSCEMQ